MNVKQNLKLLLRTGMIIPMFLSCTAKEKQTCFDPYTAGPAKLEYHNPEITVDLDVGFKSVPMPMDFDGDGDLDLLVSESGSYAESGVYYFENISGNVEMPLFRYGMRVSTERFRLGYDGMCFEVSDVQGHQHVITPDRVNDKLLIYKDVPQNVFWDRQELPLKATGYIPDTKYNRWKMIDPDADGVYDLVCGLNRRNGQGYLLLFKNTGTNEKPAYRKPQIILTTNGTHPEQEIHLKMGTTLADFDHDGDYDYIAVGPYAGFVYFENTGTPEHYAFAEGRYLKYQGKKLQMESHYGGAVKTTAIDWDGDGYTDIIAGDEDGKVSFIKNTGKLVDGTPEFLPPRFFQQEARFVDLGALTAPRVFDWDGDGKTDIVSGNGAGYIGFIKNLGGDIPRWDKPQWLKADGKVIRLIPPDAHWGYTTIDVGYWNEDQLPDILANNHNGNVVWFENTGTPGHPRLAPAQPVKVSWKGKPLRPAWVPGKAGDDELLAPWRTSPLIKDFNNDGLNDLVMLDHQGYLSVYLRFRDPEGILHLGPPERRFTDPQGHPILLNQRTGSSSGRLKITFADWNGDGREDLIVSSKPAVDWFRNEGRENGKMILVYMGRIISRTLMGHTDGPVTCDWNRDGIPDLLIGTETGAFYFWQRTRSHITTTMTTDKPQKPAGYAYFKR